MMPSSFAHRILPSLLFLLVLPGAGHSAQDPKPNVPAGQDDQYKLKVNVDMVVLSATVLNHSGAPVSGLVKEDFQVYEDGVLQQITHFSHEDVPVTVGLVVDNSRSMRPKREDVVLAAVAFARSSNPKDQMFVVNFNEYVSFGLPADLPFTDKPGQLQVALSSVRADGKTALYDAVAAALEHLKKGTRDKKVLIVVSDGGDNASQHKLDQVMALANQSDAMIYTLGIFDDEDLDKNPGVLKRIAKATGGETFLPKLLNEVSPICERIAHDIRSQYTIAYVPTNRSQDAKYRNIQVKATGAGQGKLSVRTRAGYTVKPQTAPVAIPKAQ
ncbi:MAG: VWA domain-containing protein [Acidipila sp.]|nr:VWA domain-containing protein [Acidipila sp.]